MLKPPLLNAGEAQVVEVAADHAGLERRRRERVAAVQRELLEVLGFDRLTDGDVGLERRRVRGDGDHFGQRAGLEREGEGDAGGGVELDRRAGGLLEAVELDEMSYRRASARDAVEAGRIGDGGARLLGRDLNRGDRDTGHDTCWSVTVPETWRARVGSERRRAGDEQRRGKRDTAPCRAELGDGT